MPRRKTIDLELGEKAGSDASVSPLFILSRSAPVFGSNV